MSVRTACHCPGSGRRSRNGCGRSPGSRPAAGARGRTTGTGAASRSPRQAAPGCPVPSAERPCRRAAQARRSEEHTSELQSRLHLVCRLLLEKKKNKKRQNIIKLKKKKKQRSCI